jgi:prevent-host-death family protein
VGRSAGAVGGVGSVCSRCERTFVLSSNRKGAIAETQIAAAATKLGIPVLRPVVEHGRYDLGFELGDRILRVQCKWGSLDEEGAVIRVNLQTSRHTPQGYVFTPYSADEIDAVAVYCAALDRCYLLPISLVEGRRAIHLRMTPPRNGQRACINLASDFELARGCSSAGRATRWQRVGQGFESPQLHPAIPSETEVGCHQFRNHFGYYLERAAAGDEILIRRHGRPYARLVPVQPRLAAA